MIRNLRLFAFSFLILINAQADIGEFSTMKAALEIVDSETLVLFDLDNTVMMTPQTIGCEEWFDYLVEKRIEENKKNGMSEKEAVAKGVESSVSDWTAFHSKVQETIPVEADTASLIAGVQAKGAKTMALTGRGYELVNTTREALKDIGINLALAAPYGKTFEIKKPHGKSLYAPGLLMVGALKKGEALLGFLKETKLKPKKIVFIDNKKSHVDAVGKALEATGIPYYGRRHSTMDTKIAAMDKAVADIQTKYYFGEPLSNDDAKKLSAK